MDNTMRKRWDWLEDQFELLSPLCRPIDRTRLTEEVCQHPELLRHARTNWARAKRILAQAIRDKSESWADMCSDERRTQTEAYNKGDGPKPTKDSVDQAVRSASTYVGLANDLADAQELVDRYEGLCEAIKDRGWRLRDAVKLALDSAERDFIRDSPPRPRTYQGAPVDADKDTEDTPTRRRRFNG